MSDMRINGFGFDRGIEGISYADRETDTRKLPDRQSLAPPADGVKAQLTALLDTPNTTRFLNDSLRPNIVQRDLLLPGRYGEALSDALAGLNAAAEQDSDNSRALNRAVRLLKDEVGLRDLVQMYRSALYQG